MDQVSKPSVRYRPAVVPSVSCGTCVMFHPGSGTCDLVEGAIDAGDVCDRWEAPQPPGSKDGLPALYVDIDGVLAFQPEGSILAVNGRFGTRHLVTEATTYPWTATIPAEQRDWLDANRPVVTANLAPDTIAINVVRKAVKARYPVTIATERDPSLLELTAAWLRYWQVPYGALAVVGSGGKADLLGSRPDGDAILIDDDPAKELLAGDGLQVWVPPRPWTPENDPPDGVWRFGSWRDVKKKLGLLRLAVPRHRPRPASRIRRTLLRVAPRRRLLRRVALLGVRRRGWRGRLGAQFPEPLVVRGHELGYVPVVALHGPLVRDVAVRALERHHRGCPATLPWLELSLGALG